MTEVKEKGTGKTLIIVLVVLVAALLVSNAYVYISLQGQITALTNDKTSLQGQVNTLTTDKASLQSQLTTLNNTHQTYVSAHTYTNSEYNALNSAYQNYVASHTYSDSEYNDLQDEWDLYYNIALLNYYQTFVDRETVYHAVGYYYHWTYEIYYAGYVVVTVHTSTEADTCVQVVYSAYGVEFDQTINVGGGGTATFPLLPCDNVDIRVGNIFDDAATYTVSIVVYY